MHPASVNSRVGNRSTKKLLLFQTVLLVVLLAAALVLGLSLRLLENKKTVYTDVLSVPASLQALYGSNRAIARHNSTSTGKSSSSCPYQLLLFSYFNSKASLLARLLILMGVFAGHGSRLRIGG